MNSLKLILDNKHLTTDEHHTDQLLIFMALANGKSTIVCGEISLHTQTMFELLQIFIPGIEIDITPIGNEEEGKANVIGIKGIAYKGE